VGLERPDRGVDAAAVARCQQVYGEAAEGGGIEARERPRRWTRGQSGIDQADLHEAAEVGADDLQELAEPLGMFDGEAVDLVEEARVGLVLLERVPAPQPSEDVERAVGPASRPAHLVREVGRLARADLRDGLDDQLLLGAEVVQEHARARVERGRGRPQGQLGEAVLEDVVGERGEERCPALRIGLASHEARFR
jgi:hypothetical protein